MDMEFSKATQPNLTRRHLLRQSGAAISGIAMADLLARDGLLADEARLGAWLEQVARNLPR